MSHTNGLPECLHGAELINKGSIVPEPMYQELAEHLEGSNTIDYNIFNTRNPNLLQSVCQIFKPDRTYEKPDSTYLIVLSPRNRWAKKDYVRDIKRIEKLLRNKLNYKRCIITRETDAKKVHYNVMVTTDKDILKMHNKTFGRFYNFYVQKTPRVSDIYKSIKYICKEGDIRPMIPERDKFVYCKK